MAKSKPLTITLTLSEPQYNALISANILMMEHMIADGPESIGQTPQVPRSLDSADRQLRRAWDRAKDGF
jgi:hypothetical protein